MENKTNMEKAININGKVENKIYEELRQYVKDNHGFGSALKDTDLYKRYCEAQESLRQFVGKRVKLKYRYTADFMGGSGFKFGKIGIFKEKDKEHIVFYDGLNRSCFNYLDFGLYDGFYAVLIVLEIEEAKQEDFKQYLKEQKEIKLKRRWGF